MPGGAGTKRPEGSEQDGGPWHATREGGGA